MFGSNIVYRGDDYWGIGGSHAVDKYQKIGDRVGVYKSIDAAIIILSYVPVIFELGVFDDKLSNKSFWVC